MAFLRWEVCRELIARRGRKIGSECPISEGAWCSKSGSASYILYTIYRESVRRVSPTMVRCILFAGFRFFVENICLAFPKHAIVRAKTVSRRAGDSPTKAFARASSCASWGKGGLLVVSGWSPCWSLRFSPRGWSAHDLLVFSGRCPGGSWWLPGDLHVVSCSFPSDLFVVSWWSRSLVVAFWCRSGLLVVSW